MSRREGLPHEGRSSATARQAGPVVTNMTPQVAWRGPFHTDEVHRLHAEAFQTRLSTADEWDWEQLVAAHSLGWVVARQGPDLVGFANVLWDGLVHAWIQDVMVAASGRRLGVGRTVVAEAADGARRAGCEWLHVDFEPHLRAFYVDACGFTPSEAGLLRL